MESDFLGALGGPGGRPFLMGPGVVGPSVLIVCLLRRCRAVVRAMPRDNWTRTATVCLRAGTAVMVGLGGLWCRDGGGSEQKELPRVDMSITWAASERERSAAPWTELPLGFLRDLRHRRGLKATEGMGNLSVLRGTHRGSKRKARDA